jgi:hypothetical protein
MIKKRILLIYSVFISIVVQAQVSKTINVSSPGTLSSDLTVDEKDSVTNLTVTGTIDVRDFVIMRDSMPLLSSIDLGLATIAAYNDSTGLISYDSAVYSANSLPIYSFFDPNNYQGKQGLKSVVLPNTLSAIGYAAFGECSSLSSVSFPSSLTTIGGYAFYGCDSLTALNLPTSVVAIGGFSFYGCTGLTSINIPSSDTAIAESTFFGCTALTSLTIPPSVLSIRSSAFSGCTALLTATISSSVTSIDNLAFYECTNLQSIAIPASVTSIGNGAFADCSATFTVDANNPDFSSLNYVLYNKPQTQLIACPVSLKGSYIIPPTVDSIASNAFFGCDSLSAVSIPASVLKMGIVPFGSCSALITVDPQNLHYSSLDGVLFNKTLDSLIQCPTSLSGSYIIPSTVKTICYAAFENCIKLISITIPKSVVFIDNYAFYNCYNLQSLYENTDYPIDMTYSTKALQYVDQSFCTLYIPFSSLSLYNRAQLWQSFSNIVEEPGIFVTPDSVVLNVSSNNTNSAFVMSNINWIASADQSWITVSPDTTVSGDGVINILALHNPSKISRTATITVTAANLDPKKIIVTQAGEYTITLSTDSLQIGTAANSKATLQVSSDTLWSVSYDQPWITPDITTSPSNNATITFTTTANISITPRIVHVTIHSDNALAQMVTINQPGDTILSVSTNAITLQDTAKFEVQSNTTWSISSDQNWVSVISSNTINGDSLITVIASINPTVTARTANITITAPGAASQIITLTQQPGAVILTVSETNFSVDAIASTPSVTITSNTTWTALSDQSWLTIGSNLPITGNATLLLSAAANQSTTVRTATVTVSANGVATKTITITQAAGTISFVDIENTNDLKLFPNPASTSFGVNNEGNITVQVYSLPNECVIHTNVSGKEAIAIQSLSAGMYIVKIMKGTSVTFRTLLVK